MSSKWLQQGQVERAIDLARESAQDQVNFAEVIVHLAGRCVMGLPCARHGGTVHGREAEELRAGIEQAIFAHGDLRKGDLRKELIALLDRVDACDSLAFLEATETDSSSDGTHD